MSDTPDWADELAVELLPPCFYGSMCDPRTHERVCKGYRSAVAQALREARRSGGKVIEIEALEKQIAYLKTAAHSFSTDTIAADERAEGIEHQLTALRHAAVELSLPVGVLLCDKELRRRIAPEVLEAMEAGIIKMRAALLSGESAERKQDGDN